MTDAAIDWLAENGYEPEYGARPLRRLIQREVDDRIAELFVSGALVDGGAVTVDAAAGAITVSAERPVAARRLTNALREAPHGDLRGLSSRSDVAAGWQDDAMTLPSRRVGAIFLPDLPPERLRDYAQAAESAGVDELWLWEDCFREGAFASAGAALAWTERLRIGIGISPMPLRNVAMTAMEIATVERMFPGRLIPGVGHGVLSWMGQVGARVASPLTLMREYVTALRALLAGELVTTSGRYVNLDAVKLDWPPAVAPLVLAAAEGPKTLALTGEVADGTVLTGGTSVAQVKAARELIAEGRAGRARVSKPGLGGAP